MLIREYYPGATSTIIQIKWKLDIFMIQFIKQRAGRYRPELHPKVILWDGIKYVNAKEKDFEGKQKMIS